MEFELLYETYHKAILHYCNKFFESNNIVTHLQLAEDFTQEAFIEAYKQWATFEGESHLKRFLYLVAANRCRNELQKIRRREKDHKSILYLGHEGELPDYLAINSDVISFLLEELENLPPRQQQILKLFFKGLNSNEIAAELCITRKTVLNLKLNAFGFLRTQLIKPKDTRLELLSPLLRNVYEMLYTQNLSVQEVADKLHITEERVRENRREAIKRLSKRLS